MGVRVAVCGTHPLGHPAALAQLRRRPELEVLPAEQHSRAEMAVAFLPTVTSAALDHVEEVTGRVAGAPPGLVVVTDHLGREDVRRAVRLGLVSVVQHRCATWDGVVAAIVAAHRGRSELPAVVVGWLLDLLRDQQADALCTLDLTAPGLCAREVAVLRLLADGMNTAEVARTLCYSERTIKNVLHGLMARFRLRTRSHAVAFALKAGAF